MTWPEVPLGEVVTFLDHLRRPITGMDRQPGSIPYYGANGQQDSVAGHLFDEPLVLLAEDGGHFNAPERGVAYKIEGPSWVNNHAHVLRAKPTIDNSYLFRVLQNRDLSAFVTGTTRAKLTKGSAERISIPLPPLPEQRRIASILDQADSLRAMRRLAIQLLDESVAARTEEAVEAAENVELLGDLVSEFRYGTSVKSGPSGTVVLRIPNVSKRILDLNELKTVDLLPAEKSRLLLAPGDLLIVRSNGNRNLVGATVEYPTFENPREHVFASYLIRARPRLGVNATYLSRYLGSKAGRAALHGGSTTSAGQYNINTKTLGNLKIPLPDIGTQISLSSYVIEIEAIRRLHLKSLAKLDELFASLQHSAFRGEL